MEDKFNYICSDRGLCEGDPAAIDGNCEFYCAECLNQRKEDEQNERNS